MSQSPVLVRRVDNENKKPFDLSDLGTEIVTIVAWIGNTRPEQSFTVHKNLACYYSTVLKAEFETPRINTMDLKCTTARTVAILIRWMYSGSIRNVEGNSFPGWVSAMELWLLADKLVIPQLQNKCMVAILEHQVITNQFPRYPVFFGQRVYQDTLPDSPLRKLLVDQVVDCMGVEGFTTGLAEDPEQFTLEFVTDIAIALMAKHNPGGVASLAARWDLYMVPVPGE